MSNLDVSSLTKELDDLRGSNTESQPTPTPEPSPEPQAKVEDEAPKQEAKEESSNEVVSSGKSWWEDEEEKTSNPEKKEDVVLSNDDLQAEIQRLREYEAVIQNNLELKAIYEGAKSNKRIDEVLKEIKGVDVDSMSPSDLRRHELQSKGLSPEDISELMEEFEELSPARQKERTADIKARLKSEQEDRIKKFNTPNEEMAAKVTANIENANKDLQSISREMDGKEVYGITLTSDMIKKIQDKINNEYVFGDERNGFDIGRSFDYHLKNLFLKDIVKANVTKAKNNAKEEILNDITRPDKQIVSRPTTSQQSSDLAEMEAIVARRLGY